MVLMGWFYWGVGVAAAVSLCGCASFRELMEDKPEPSRLKVTWHRSPKPAKPPPKSPEQVLREESAEIDDRIKAVRAEAERLAKEDGEATVKLSRRISGCRNGFERCEEEALAMENQVAGLTGIAVYLVDVPRYVSSEFRMKGLVGMEPKVAQAEKYIEQAKVEAEKSKDQMAAQYDALTRERAGQEAATVECDKGLTVCKKRCDEGVAAFCTALGVKLAEAKPPKFADAVDALKQACDAGWQSGCVSLEEAQKDWQVYSQKTDSLWSEVESAVDSIAEKKHIAKFAQQNLRGRRNARATERVKMHISALLKESYCPAVNTFKAERTQAEFNELAKAHCDDRPPTGTGLSGVTVTLTAECRSTYLTPCSEMH